MARPHDDAAALAALLEPWWRAFPDDCLDIHREDDTLVMRPRLRSLGLKLFSPHEERETTWQEYCESVEILLLASMVEPIAFRDMLQSRCKRLEKECFDCDPVFPLRLHVQLRVYSGKHSSSKGSTWSVQALKTLFGTTNMRSDVYKETRSILAQMASERRLDLDNAVVPVDFSLSQYTIQETIDTLGYLVELQRQQRQTLADSSLFVVGKVSLGSLSPNDSVELYDALDQCMATPGFQLDMLRYSGSIWEFSGNRISRDRKRLHRWATAVTGMQTNPSAFVDHANQDPGDQVLARSHRVKCQQPTKSLLTGLCSSLMVSKSVDELEVDLNISQYSLSCQYEWCWLFYTLFNGASARSVTTLRLNATDILMDDFIQVRKLVRSRNPLEMLLDLDLDEEMEADGRPQRPESTLSRPAQVIVRDGTPVYLDILRSQHPLIMSSGSRVFDVMHELNDAYDILVPGYGQCWVTKEDVAVEIPRSEENARDRWRLETHPITKLSVTMNRSVLEERDQTGLRVLLKLIGTPIKQLSLGCEWHEGLDPSLLDFVWSSCPNIVYLSVGNMSLDSFDDIVAAYASGRCQVSELSLTECNPFDTESPVAFVKKLADPKTPISKTLHQLHLGLSDVTDRFMPNEVLEAFLTMLETNERLRFLQLEVGEDQIDSYNPRFAAFRGQTIRYPLAWSTKCAFLSVVKHVQHFDSVDHVIPPIGRLDSLSLSRIFAFAGGFHTRSVVLSPIQ